MRQFAILSLFLTVPAVAADPPPARVELPIRAVLLSDGARRYAVPISIDGVAMEAGLDTGSTGLRVLARAVPDMSGDKGHRTHYQFGSGVTFDGITDQRPVALGSAIRQISVMRVDKLGCSEGHSGCAGERLDAAHFGIQGDGLRDEGFPAIFGTNLAPDSVPNPLRAAGFTRWIVELPRPGDATPGRLVLNPTDEEVGGYTRIKLIAALADVHGGTHDALPGCFVRTDNQAHICGPVLFDTGAPGLRVAGPARIEPWPNGTPGMLVIGDGANRIGIAFQSGRRDQASAMRTELRSDFPGPRLYAGLLPYFAWSVLYDAKEGVIGVKAR